MTDQYLWTLVIYGYFFSGLLTGIGFMIWATSKS
jgi:hypothetical protein